MYNMGDFGMGQVIDVAPMGMGTTLGHFGSTEQALTTAGSKADPGVVEKFRQQVAALFQTRNKVDAILAKMPAGPKKDHLLKLRSESRGFFDKYIDPLWKKVAGWIQSQGAKPLGEFDMGESYLGDDSQMGYIQLLALVPILVKGAAAVGITYMATSTLREKTLLDQAILANPNLSQEQKATLVGGSSISSTVGSVSQLLMLGGALYVGTQFILPMIAAKNAAKANPRRRRRSRRHRYT